MEHREAMWIAVFGASYSTMAHTWMREGNSPPDKELSDIIAEESAVCADSAVESFLRLEMKNEEETVYRRVRKIEQDVFSAHLRAGIDKTQEPDIQPIAGQTRREV